MAFTNFIPEFWAEKILRDNKKLTVLGNLANRQYEGLISKKGDTVNIPGLGEVNIGDYTGAPITMQTVEDTSTKLEITQAKYFAVIIDDVDKRQALPETLGSIMAEAEESLVEKADEYLGKTLLDATGTESITPAGALTTETAWGTIHSAITKLRKNGVTKATKLCAIVTPEYFERVLRKKESFDYQNNGDIQENGFEGKINGCEIYVSNNLPQDSSGKDVCFVFTKQRALAYAEQIAKTEACRPTDLFADVVKGLHLYGATVVRPKEVCKIVLDKGYDA